MFHTHARLLIVPMFSLAAPALGATTLYTDQSQFMLALGGNATSNTRYYTPPGYPQRIISSPTLTVYERDVPAIGEYDCQATPTAPYCFVNGLYGAVSSTGQWTDHLFTKSPDDPTIVSNVASNATQLFMSNGKSIGFGTVVSVGSSASPVQVSVDGNAFNLPAGYQGFLGVLNTPNTFVQEVAFTNADAAGVNVSMTTPFTVQYAPEPGSILLFGIGLLVLAMGGLRRMLPANARTPYPACLPDPDTAPPDF